MPVSTHTKFKGVMDARGAHKKNIYWQRYKPTCPLRLGPCLASDLATRKVSLWIPHYWHHLKTAEEAKKGSGIWLYWQSKNAKWNEQEHRFEYELTEKQDLARWLSRARERFNELWKS